MQFPHRLRRLAAALLLIPLCAVLVPAEAQQRTQQANVTGVLSFSLPPEDLVDSGVPRIVRGPLILAADGNVYFGSSSGGDGFGTVAVLEPGNDELVRTLYSFQNREEGYSPFGGVIQGTDQNLYGTTYLGGEGKVGSIFKLGLDGTFTQLHEFAKNGSQGRYPYTGLTQGSDGYLYGTTITGGASKKGVVFRIATDGTDFSVLHNFGGSDGDSPEGQLLALSDGYLYGTTMLGGSGKRGVIYRISTTGEFQRLYSFPSLNKFSEFGLATNTDGANPRAGLIQGNDGNLYGTAYQGGEFGNGTLFRAVLSGDSATVEVVHAFRGWPEFDGGFPAAPVVQGPDGDFYGTSERGGYSDAGTVWKVAADGSSFELLHGYLNSATDGSVPYSNVMFAGGNLYSVTTSDSFGSSGSIIKIDRGTAGVLPVELTVTTSTSRPEIEVGESFDITWNAPDAVTCDKFSSWNEPTLETDPEHITPTSGTKTLAPGAGVYSYGLACTDAAEVVRNMIVGVIVNPRPLEPVDGGAIAGGGEISWLLLALLVALLSVKVFKETRYS